MSKPAAVTIDIWSDVMCPWCVIGHNQLETALKGMAGEVSATVRFHPFELNPDMPEAGEESAAHIQRKYGRTPDQAADARGRMAEAAEAAGYSFHYTGAKDEGGDPPPAMMWNTRLAHRLLVAVLRDHGPEMQVKLKRALFDAHFQQRRRMNDPAVLTDIAASVGLDRTEAAAALTDPEIDAIVDAGEQQAWDWNISGVPAMVINGKYMIPGAQDPATYANALRRVVAREAAVAAAE
ncbi:DsbA family oxidoreductase [Novosphingobium sp. PASSN1]|uniref:DsbA family oxidoreductase n=1 Tax=Novosphingobium sp. PASSN1 TaxID=2015561 RepID=UPI000BDB4A24|nr:DsbA family oxidoreductase [Novosphingobium sp. PASSN1]OYU35017.1 MAG: 2-hydroxychromene-2-carboxylate isomerase [Novosphingobium sp. PASSN1]